jgi:hypothetical protein
MAGAKAPAFSLGVSLMTGAQEGQLKAPHKDLTGAALFLFAALR